MSLDRKGLSMPLQTRRQFLVEKGLAKEGRGKFSTAALAELEKARAAGIKFSDEVVITEGNSTIVKPTNAVQKDKVYTDIIYTYPESDYRAVEVKSKKERSMRSACNTCRVSLVAHGCDSPTIVAMDGSGSVSVRIEKR